MSQTAYPALSYPSPPEVPEAGERPMACPTAQSSIAASLLNRISSSVASGNIGKGLSKAVFFPGLRANRRRKPGHSYGMRTTLAAGKRRSGLCVIYGMRREAVRRRTRLDGMGCEKGNGTPRADGRRQPCSGRFRHEQFGIGGGDGRDLDGKGPRCPQNVRRYGAGTAGQYCLECIGAENSPIAGQQRVAGNTMEGRRAKHGHKDEEQCRDADSPHACLLE